MAARFKGERALVNREDGVGETQYFTPPVEDRGFTFFIFIRGYPHGEGIGRTLRRRG